MMTSFSLLLQHALISFHQVWQTYLFHTNCFEDVVLTKRCQKCPAILLGNQFWSISATGIWINNRACKILLVQKRTKKELWETNMYEVWSFMHVFSFCGEGERREEGRGRGRGNSLLSVVRCMVCYQCNQGLSLWIDDARCVTVFHRISSILQTELGVSDVPRSMAWCGHSICVGFKRDYFLIGVSVWPPNVQDFVLTLYLYCKSVKIE